jgi:hypothetical protein
VIREYLGKKAAQRLDRTKFGGTRTGKISAVVLDDDRLDDVGYAGLLSIGDKLQNPRLRFRTFALAIAVNCISWISLFVIPSVVAKVALAFALILPKGGLILAAPALGFTMMGTYALLRVWFPVRTYSDDDGAIMQSYGRDTESLLTWKLWLVSCGTAGINAISLIATYFITTGEYEIYTR